MGEPEHFEPNAPTTVKALLSLLLLQHGATSREILTTLRMAAATRGQDVHGGEQATSQDREQIEFEQPAYIEPAPIPIQHRPHISLKPDMLPAEIRPSTPKQRLRNDYLAPIERPHRAA